MVNAIVNKQLPQNLLSASQIVKHIGPITLDWQGAALVNDQVYQRIEPKINYFAHRKNRLYEVELRNGVACMADRMKHQRR